MDPAAYLAALRSDGAALADACATTSLDVAVPSCPGWDLGDLLWHLTTVHGFWTAIVADRLTEPSNVAAPSRPSAGELLDNYLRGVAELADVLGDASPDTPVWTWAPDHSVGFIQRRVAHETAVHRWDAEHAAGEPSPIEAKLASDGIDEVLHHTHGGPRPGAAPIGGTVHLHCTDVAGEWLVAAGEHGGPFTVTCEHAKGDCALRGPASDLLLVVWRRLSIERLDVLGDRSVAERFLAYSALGRRAGA